MEDYLALLAENEKPVILALADEAIKLGYRVKRDKTKDLSYGLVHPKISKRILRFTLNKGKPMVRLKYFAAPTYSDYFHEAIRRTIEEHDYRYTGCYGCGSCDGTQGYTYRYADGREYYRCGTELIELPDVGSIPLDEILALFRIQHAFYLDQI